MYSPSVFVLNLSVVHGALVHVSDNAVSARTHFITLLHLLPWYEYEGEVGLVQTAVSNLKQWQRNGQMNCTCCHH